MTRTASNTNAPLNPPDEPTDPLDLLSPADFDALAGEFLREQAPYCGKQYEAFSDWYARRIA